MGKMIAAPSYLFYDTICCLNDCIYLEFAHALCIIQMPKVNECDMYNYTYTYQEIQISSNTWFRYVAVHLALPVIQSKDS